MIIVIACDAGMPSNQVTTYVINEVFRVRHELPVAAEYNRPLSYYEVQMNLPNVISSLPGITRLAVLKSMFRDVDLDHMCAG